MQRETVPSPCIKRCNLDHEKCTGCGRLLHEIAKWSKMTDDEKREVLKRLK